MSVCSCVRSCPFLSVYVCLSVYCLPVYVYVCSIVFQRDKRDTAIAVRYLVTCIANVCSAVYSVLLIRAYSVLIYISAGYTTNYYHHHRCYCYTTTLLCTKYVLRILGIQTDRSPCYSIHDNGHLPDTQTPITVQ